MRYHGRSPAQAPLDGLGDPPSERDEQLARIFSNMRLSMKASRELIARRLAIAVSTVDTLEAGAVAAFPHWRETERIVRSYCELLRLDPHPILWRIRGQLQALASSARSARPPRPAARAHAGARTPPAPARTAQRPARRRRRGRMLFALSAPVALAAVVVYVIHLAPGPVYRAVALLPQALRGPARAGLDHVILLTAAQRDGLRWVDVSDPRARKADKLQGRR